MRRQIRILTALQLSNLFGLNEFRHTKDKSKRKRWIGLAAVWGFLCLMLISYVLGLCAGLARLDLAQLIPEYLFAAASLMILFFSMFKAGSVIFENRTYEMMISLPVSRTAIVTSRFLTLYATDLFTSFLLLTPGLIFYGILKQPGVSFYLFGLLGVLLLPLLPLTLSTAVGAGITAISARMRHKSLVSAGFTILLVCGFLLFPAKMGGGAEDLSHEMLQNFTDAATAQIRTLYPPAAWFGKTLIGGSIVSFLLLVCLSAALFVLTVCVVQRWFVPICSALNASSAKNSFTMQKLKSASVLRALFSREIKRYFASSIYVTNTLIGAVLMMAAALGLLFAGPQKIEAALELPGVLTAFLPFVLGAAAALAPTTACSISMEGRQWWIAKTLPVRTKDILDSKILVDLVIFVPACLAASVLSIIALKPAFTVALWILLVPMAYALFSAVAGITVNLSLPMLNWENEARAVKQGMSTMVAMLIDLVSVFVPVALLIFLKDTVPADWIMAFWLVVLCAVTAALYAANNKKSLIGIE